MGELNQAYGTYHQALRIGDAYADKESEESIKNHVTTLNGIGNIEIGPVQLRHCR